MLGKSTPNLQIRERPGPPDPEIKEGGGGRPPQKKKFGSWGLSLVKNYGRGGGGGGGGGGGRSARSPLDPPLVITETELWIISVS